MGQWFNNEDFADYVVGVSLMYKKGEIQVSREKLEEIINHYYVRYCYARHLAIQPLVPIRSIQYMILPS